MHYVWYIFITVLVVAVVTMVVMYIHRDVVKKLPIYFISLDRVS
jgi:hypothetical protein